MPGDGRPAEAQLLHQGVVHREALVAERSQGAGGAPELADQHARRELLKPLAVAYDHAEPDGGLVAEGHRQCVLKMRAARHHGRAVLLREARECRVDGSEIRVDQCQGVADLQHGRGVHDVLCGGAPVHVAAGIAALLGELMHDADDRVADEIGFRLELARSMAWRAPGA